MQKGLLDKFLSRLSECHSVESYISVLSWGISEYKAQSEYPSSEIAISNPVALMTIEVYLKCPEAVENYAYQEESVSIIYNRLNNEKQLQVI
ncbi:hypothetical protein [Cytobacillus gottheilii]|nr:hypothetical protein [Cytobacillus gottheilii]QVY63976.1 hypothetical protein J1899_22320 [Cytobacillus gottheilii]